MTSSALFLAPRPPFPGRIAPFARLAAPLMGPLKFRTFWLNSRALGIPRAAAPFVS
jgi:hypothetical protein|tara:strand:- start:1564 stop:1731 length:168 start_codon:yes stop_codon:yes gene_type:complete